MEGGLLGLFLGLGFSIALLPEIFLPTPLVGCELKDVIKAFGKFFTSLLA